MAATLAELGFDIDTRSIKDATKSLDKLDRQSGTTEKSASKFSRGYTKSMDAVKVGTLAASAAIVGISAALVKYTNDGLENIDMLAKLARAQGATADGIRAVQIAASDAGLDGMASSLTRLTRRLGAAEMGNKEYGDTVKALGLEISELSKLDADEKVGAIADAVKTSGLSMEETARHLQNLGFEQSNANAFFRAGGDAVRNARSEVEDYGLSLSAIDTAKVEAANDAWSRTSLATEAATNQLAVAMTPVIQTVAQYLNDAAKEGDGLGEAIERGVQAGVEAFAKLADIGAGVVVTFEVLGKSIAAGMLGAEAAVLSMALTIADKPISAINSLIEAMNTLTGSSIGLVGAGALKELERDATSANMAFQTALDDIHETIMKPLPSSGILEHYKSVKKAAEESAEEAVKLAEIESKASQKQLDAAKKLKSIKDEAAKSAKDEADAVAKQLKSTDDLRDAIDGFASSTKDGLNNLKGLFKEGDSGTKALTIGIAALNAVQAVNAVINQAQGDPYSAPGRMAAMAGAMASLGYAVGFSGSGSERDISAERQASQGTGTILGSANEKSRSIEKAVDITAEATSELVGINRSMLRALEGVNAGIRGASSRVAAGSEFTGATPAINNGVIGSAADAYLDGLSTYLTGGLVDFGGIIGGSSKKKDEGIVIVGGYISDLIDETMVDAYATFKVKKHAFDGGKNKTKTQRLGDEIGTQFSLVFDSVLDSVIAGADVFGIDSAATSGFSVGTQKLSLKGLDAGQQQAAIEEYFGTVFDNLTAHTIPWLDEFQMAGEGLGETLARVATETQVAQQAIEQMGIQFADLAGRDLVEASSRLIELSGGLEQFISSMKGFIQNFASDAQQFEIAQNSLTSAFEQANLALPETRQGYYDLLQAQDGSTAAGAENIATLLRLQSTASDYYQSLEDGSDAALAAQKANLQDMAQSQSAALSASRASANAVDSALAVLSGSNISSAASRQSALSSLSDMTQSGRIGSASDLSALLGSATNIDASDFASFGEYIREVSKTGAVLSGLKQVTDSKVTKDQQLLESILKQQEAMSEQLIMLSEANVKQSAKSARILDRIETNGVKIVE